MRAALIAVLLVGCSSAAPKPPAFEEACPICTGQPVADAGVFTPDNMLGERWGELNPTVETHMTLISSSLEPHLRGGAGFEFAKGLTRNDRVRFIKSTAFTGGAWGDQRHGQFMIESGLGVRITLSSDQTLIDPYIQATEGLIWGFGGLNAGRSDEMGNVAGLGFGLRLFRAFSAEFTGRAISALDTPFRATDGTAARVLPEFGLALRFDFCSLGSTCNYAAIQQKTDDRTCGIYTDAKDICKAASKAGGAERANLCKNAVAAMSLKDSGDPVLARNAVSTFLRNLAESSPNTALLVDSDKCMTMWRACGRKQECLLAQQEEKPVSRRMYSPYVLELLAALGCGADGKPTRDDCAYTCEVKAVKPAVCMKP